MRPKPQRRISLRENRKQLLQAPLIPAKAGIQSSRTGSPPSRGRAAHQVARRIADGPLPRSPHPGAQFRSGADRGRHHGDAAGAQARRRERHRSVSHHRLRPAWPHRRARRRIPHRARAGLGAGERTFRIRHPRALSRRAVRGSAARRHAQDHRRAADAGQADHPAFLSHRRYRHRCAAEGAQRGERCGAETGWRAGLQDLGQRLRHQGAGAGAEARAGRQRDLRARIASCASSAPISALRSRSKAGC